MKLNLENYKNIVESLNEGIAILDKDNNILYSNKYLLRLLSYRSKDILNINFKNLFNKKKYKQLEDCLKSSQNTINDIEIYDKKNTKHYVNISIQNHQ